MVLNLLWFICCIPIITVGPASCGMYSVLLKLARKEQTSTIKDFFRAFKENIKVINIFSMKMINTSGFLRRVFEIFSESKVSVDLISTSEANISVTVDASEKIDKVVEQLSEFADVIVDDDKSQVSVIGKNIVRLNGMLKKTFAPLKRTNVYMISQGASFVNISFVVDREELTEVVKDLHYHLFEVEEELEQF